MARLTVRLFGDPVLRQVAEPVTEFGDELDRLAADMIDTMHHEDGIGLAAPQVGLSIRFITIALPVKDDNGNEVMRIHAMANPEIVAEGDADVCTEEGCLSLPEITVPVTRPEQITVRYQTLKGETAELEADGLLAVVIQHEMDHLDGVMITDFLPPLKKSMMRGKLKKLEQEAREIMESAG